MCAFQPISHYIHLLQRRWRHRKKLPSMLDSHQITIFSRLRWSLLALPMSQLFTSSRCCTSRGFLSCCFYAAQWRLAVCPPHCLVWLKLDDEAVRVTVGLRLGLDLCEPHQCHCGSVVDARGLHSFVCKK